MALASLKHALLACTALVAGGFVAVPVVQHLHAAPRATKSSGTLTDGPNSQARREVAPPANLHQQLHRFFMGLLHGEFFTAAADEKKDDKPKPLTGTWVKKEGELRITFEKTELKLSPHGKDDLILILCECTTGKDGGVKAKITGFEGKAEAKKAISEKIPVGTEFGFKWSAKDGSATLSEVTGEKAGPLKSHLEGEFEEKK